MRGYEYKDKVSVVPLIDVSLVVVLALMVISPFLNNNNSKVDLPKARASEVNDEQKTEVVYALDGTITIDDHPVQLADVRALLAPRFAENPESVAVICADRGLLYSDVERLIAEVKAAKAPRITIATKEHEGPGDAQR
jgi:biopolymer transport protein ExbD